MVLKNKTYEILNKYNIRAKKKFGQNFLIDENMLNKIVDISEISENDLIIEIGPGIGNLTEKLLETGAKTLCFEIDKDMGKILEDRFKGNSNFNLFIEDILKVDINQYIKEKKFTGKVKVVANLPYYITTPIIFKILESADKVDEIIVMVQKEVADRITSKEGCKDYGVLTINVNYYGETLKLFDVPSQFFVPSPNVTSSVIKIKRKKRYIVNDEKLLFGFVKAAFSQRRKKIANSLDGSNFNDLSKEEIKELLAKNNIGENTRAEEISINKFVQIVNSIKK